MWDKASVSAPAIMVDVLLETEVGVVVVSKVVRFWTSSCSTRRKGRYLLPSDEEDEDVVVVVAVSWSSMLEDDFVGGLRLSLRRLEGSGS